MDLSILPAAGVLVWYDYLNVVRIAALQRRVYTTWLAGSVRNADYQPPLNALGLFNVFCPEVRLCGGVFQADAVI